MFIYTLDHVIPEPSTWLFVSPVSSQPLQGYCEEGLGYPVLTLYLEVAVLNSLFLRNMQHRVSSLGCIFASCLCSWGDALWLQVCFPVERLDCISNFPRDHHRPFSAPT